MYNSPYRPFVYHYAGTGAEERFVQIEHELRKSRWVRDEGLIYEVTVAAESFSSETFVVRSRL